MKQADIRVPKLIFLTGFMGAGKTTTGRILAELSGWNFADLDTCIQIKAGRTIADLFSSFPESHFRKIEHERLCEIFPLNNTVVACGGGTPCFENAMGKMKNHGLTIYLKHDFEILYQRILNNQSVVRPLARSSTRDELRKIFHEREKCYSTADITYACDVNDSAEMIAVKLVRLLHLH